MFLKFGENKIVQLSFPVKLKIVASLEEADTADMQYCFDKIEGRHLFLSTNEVFEKICVH